MFTFKNIFEHLLNASVCVVKDTEHGLRHRKPLAADGTEEHFGVGVSQVTRHDR